MMARPRKNITSKPLQTASPSDVETSVLSDELPVGADRVNNILHKEAAMHKSGVTRATVYNNIKLLLDASVETREFDADRKEWVTTSVPDLDRRKQGAELALKAFGDLKEMQRVEGAVTHKQVVYKWEDGPLTVTATSSVTESR